MLFSSVLILATTAMYRSLFSSTKKFWYNFACEVLDEKLYAIGGGGSNSSYHSWETFDPLTNCWTSQTDPKIVNEIKDSVILDGKIYVRCSRYPVTPHVFAVVYEPSSGTWEYADEDIVSGWTGPAVAVDGTLYVLDQMWLLMLVIWGMRIK